MTKYQFLEKAHAIHGYKYFYIDIPDKVKNNDYINISQDNIVYSQKVSKHLSGKSPEKNTTRKTNEHFILDSKNVWGDRFDYTDTVYVGALKKVKMFDKKNNILIEQIASLHLKGHEVRSLDSNQFIEKSKIISDFNYKYDKCIYVNKTTNVIISCFEHGDFLVNPYNHLRYGEVCKKCSFTSFSKKVRKFLNSNDISFYQEYKFNDLDLPFDFFIPSKRICIDFVGFQCFQPIEYFSDIKSYKQLKINYKIKSDYCDMEYINLISIKYDQIEDIHIILNECF